VTTYLSSNGGQCDPVPEPAVGEHPWWCIRRFCTVNDAGVDGAHRSTPFKIDEPGLLTANLYAVKWVPDSAMVEVRGARILLPADEAYGLGRVLVSLGKAARDR
jgi:hypothetical protein